MRMSKKMGESRMRTYQNPYEITLTPREFRPYAERRKTIIEIPRAELNVRDCIKLCLQNSKQEILYSIEPHSDVSFGAVEEALTKAFVKIKELKRNF